MEPPPSGQVTAILLAWTPDNPDCLQQLIELLEPELRAIARRHMRRERLGHTLQTTALMNEAFLKLVAQDRVDWRNRAHFLGVAATLMRRILVDHARARGRGKRGAGAELLPLDEMLAYSPRRSRDLVALDDALQELAKHSARKAKVVELRYFGGLTVEEAAEALHVHPNTVIGDWKFARAWLKRELTGGNGLG
jgi:RNA polymerase sigma factor (TIGR02999 family)